MHASEHSERQAPCHLPSAAGSASSRSRGTPPRHRTAPGCPVLVAACPCPSAASRASSPWSRPSRWRRSGADARARNVCAAAPGATLRRRDQPRHKWGSRGLNPGPRDCESCPTCSRPGRDASCRLAAGLAVGPVPVRRPDVRQLRSTQCTADVRRDADDRPRTHPTAVPLANGRVVDLTTGDPHSRCHGAVRPRSRVGASPSPRRRTGTACTRSRGWTPRSTRSGSAPALTSAGTSAATTCSMAASVKTQLRRGRHVAGRTTAR